MAQMTGADADALDAAAKQLQQAAQELQYSGHQLSETLGSLSWIGAVAVAFSDMWNSQHRRSMFATSDFLESAAAKLAVQANEQRQASRSDGGDGGNWLHRMVDRAREIAQDMERRKAIADALAAELQRVRGLSPAEQAAWWNSLTDEQRAALLQFRPGELTGLSGLPADVLEQAQENYETSIADQLQTGSANTKIEGEARVLWVKVAGGVEAEMRTFKDGSVELELSGFIGAGEGESVAGAMAKLGLGGTFEFDSMAEAKKWLDDLAVAALKGDLEGFLRHSADHLGSVAASAGVSAEGEFEGAGVKASVSAEAGVKATVDTRGADRGDVTLSANASVSAKASGGVFGVTGDVSIESAVRFHGTQPQEVTFSLDYAGGALKEPFNSIPGLGAGAVTSGSVQLSFDLTRPEMSAVADQVAAALKRGDVIGASHALSGALDQAQVVYRQEVGSTSGWEHGVNAGPLGKVELEYSQTNSVTTGTWVKAPGGSFFKVD